MSYDVLKTKEFSKKVIQALPQKSFVASHFQRTPMSSTELHTPVLGATTGLRPTTTAANGGEFGESELNFTELTLTAETVGRVVTVPRSIVEDTSINLDEVIVTAAAEQLGLALDAHAAGLATVAPTWDKLVPAAATTADVEYESDAKLVAHLNQMIANVDKAGRGRAFVLADDLRHRLRGLVDAQKRPVFVESFQDSADPESVYARPASFIADDRLPTDVLGFCYDPKKCYWGIRKGLTIENVTDASYAKRDLKAVLVRARIGLAVQGAPVSVLRDAVK